MIRRTVMWLEAVVAALLVVVAMLCIGIFVKYGYGHPDPYNDAGMVLLLGILSAIGGTSFAVASAGLSWKRAWGWGAQVLPGSLVGWILWNIMWHR